MRRVGLEVGGGMEECLSLDLGLVVELMVLSSLRLRLSDFSEWRGR